MTTNDMASQFDLELDGAGFKERTFNDREKTDFLNRAHLLYVKQRYDALKNITQRGFATEPRDMELAGVLSGHAKFRASTHDFMKGTPDNGAFRTPDLDVQEDAVQAFGVFCRIPNEVLFIESELADIQHTGSLKVIPNVEVMKVSPSQYSRLIYDRYKNPDYDSVWAMPWGSFTTGTTGNSDVSVKGFTGISIYDNTTAVAISTMQSRHLIPGKGYNLVGYTINYIKVPKAVVVNRRDPAASVNSELPDFCHDEIVRLAVKEAISSSVPAEQKFQIVDNATKQDQ